MMSDLELKKEYQALTDESGFVILENRTTVELKGDDRNAFLHNFCTNDIKKLEPGNACEAFVLNGKGKILGYVHVLALEKELLLTGHGDQSSVLIEHLDKYVIREDVELANRTDDFVSVFVCGQASIEKLAGLVSELPDANKISPGPIGKSRVRICNVEVAGSGFLLMTRKSDLEALELALTEAGIVKCSANALELVRVERKTPWFSLDVDETNLPQELQRDDKAISFDKGCYLGQETVARIDARGRVNQLLVGFTFESEDDAKQGELVVDEKAAGRVTSLVKLPNGENIGLGYVRRQFMESGTKVCGAIVR